MVVIRLGYLELIRVHQVPAVHEAADGVVNRHLLPLPVAVEAGGSTGLHVL